MTKAIVSRVTEAGSTRAEASSAAIPGRGAVRSRSRPSRAIERFSPRIGATSATVPIAARSASSATVVIAGTPAISSEEQRRHLERDAAARQPSIRVDGVRSVRIHEGVRRGRDLGDAVVVRDDHVDPVEPGGRHLGDAGRSRVDREEERAAARARRRHGLQREPVALVDAARHVRGHVQPQPTERRHEDREARQAVGVEVADDQHALGALAGPCHARHDDGRVREQRGVVEAEGRRPEVGVHVTGCDAAPGEDRGDERRATVRLHRREERRVGPRSVRVAPPVARSQHRHSMARAACL